MMSGSGDPAAKGERIVVGVDGSPDARRALDWAVSHAGSADLIEMIYTWEQPIMGTEAGFAINPGLMAESAAALVERERDLLQIRQPESPAICARVIQGHAGRALLDAAGSANLLVVGTRGRGGFAGLLLGSTSTFLALHAPCPLVIVPGPHRGS